MNKKDKLYLVEEDIQNYINLENGWWYYCSMRRDKVIHKRKVRSHTQKSKSEPRLCPKCNFVWAREYCSINKIANSILLPDFPKYKLKKLECYFCNPKGAFKK